MVSLRDAGLYLNLVLTQYFFSDSQFFLSPEILVMKVVKIWLRQVGIPFGTPWLKDLIIFKLEFDTSMIYIYLFKDELIR